MVPLLPYLPTGSFAYCPLLFLLRTSLSFSLSFSSTFPSSPPHLKMSGHVAHAIVPQSHLIPYTLLSAFHFAPPSYPVFLKSLPLHPYLPTSLPPAVSSSHSHLLTACVNTCIYAMVASALFMFTLFPPPPIHTCSPLFSSLPITFIS